MNFSLGVTEVCGRNACPEHLSAMLSHLLSANDLLDVTPRRLLPAWRNMRTWEARVSKRLYQFLVSKKLMESHFQVGQWIGSGGESDHSLVWLELEGGSDKSSSPFKLNASWLSNENFQNLIKANWIPCDPFSGLPVALHFADNLKIIKKLVIP